MTIVAHGDVPELHDVPLPHLYGRGKAFAAFALHFTVVFDSMQIDFCRIQVTTRERDFGQLQDLRAVSCATGRHIRPVDY